MSKQKKEKEMDQVSDVKAQPKEQKEAKKADSAKTEAKKTDNAKAEAKKAEKEKRSQEKPGKLKKRLIIIGSSVLGGLLLIYFGLAIFFQNHFVFGTTINGVPCAGKTLEQVEKDILKEVEGFEMKITGKEGFETAIAGKDIDLMVIFNGELEKVKKEQQPFGWIVSLFVKKEQQVGNVVQFNEERLSERFEEMECLDNPNAVEPVSATLEYKEGSYEIVKEQEGTVVDREAFQAALWEGVQNLEKNLSMEEKGCYKAPPITSESEELLQAQATMNGYLKEQITYTFGASKEVVGAEQISQWLSLNENAEIIFDEEKVRAYVDGLAAKYNTYNKSRAFRTSYNDQTIEVKGHYGWRLNCEDETKALIEDIRNGQSKEKEPIYLARAIQHGENDIGDTYVEVNLTAQHVFLYKNGKLLIDSDCVTGKPANGNATPEGIDGITYKDKDAILRGDNYASKVTYWMPFNGNVGLHDATWRNKFGGGIYLRSGSHGCVNLPYNVAKVIFENVEAGTPVIVYSLPGTESSEQNTLTAEEQAAAENEGMSAEELQEYLNSISGVATSTTTAPTTRATQAPTTAPTTRATQAPTTAPTTKATQAPTTAPTTASTQAAQQSAAQGE